ARPGPQAPTFGKNSLAGGLTITTIRPDPNEPWGFDTEIDYGNYGREDVRAAVEVPIIQGQLAARVSYLAQNYDGHFENRVNGHDLNGEDLRVTRATLVWTPTDSIEATLIGTFLREDSTAPGADNDPDP